MGDVAQRISALEMKRAAQRQLGEQARQQQVIQPHRRHARQRAALRMHTLKMSVADSAGVKTMVDRHPQLAPRPFMTEGRFQNSIRRGTTRSERRDIWRTETAFRFGSEFVEKAAGYLPSGSAGRTSTKAATNGINLRALSQRDSTGTTSPAGRPHGRGFRPVAA